MARPEGQGVKAKRQHDWRGVAHGKHACARCGALRWQVIDSHMKLRRYLYCPLSPKTPVRLWQVERLECAP